MNQPRVALGTAVGLLVALVAACSAGDPAATPTTAMPAATATPGLDDLTPFPSELLPAGCAAGTTRELTVFEAAVEAGPMLAELCAVVGPPDWITGSGLLITVYDFDDEGQVLAAYGGGGPLVYARWLAADGELRWLIGG